jgi:uncharacterized protein DUF4304
MDSKVVNRQIRATIWPLLKATGFRATTARTAWRHNQDTVHVVNFQSFTKYNADVMGVTTFSFCVNLGCFLVYVPPEWPPKKIEEGLPYPTEAECQFRGRLSPSISQRVKLDYLWFVEEDGRNLAWCIHDVAQQIPEALKWFARLDQRAEVLRILEEEPEDMSRLWGFGRNPSPLRSYLKGYVAMSLGKDALAAREFEQAVASGCYTHLFKSATGARSRAV